jgi:thiol-disulfide isomerase/thioredoxin
MRSKAIIPMIPLSTIIAIVGLSAGIALIAGGAYYYFATASLREAAAPAASRGAFSMHETPQPIPELKFVDSYGREMTLDVFKGRTILLNIWATWCVPCRKEMPALDRLQAKMGGADFQVIALSTDRGGTAKVKDFYKEVGLEHLNIYVEEKSGTVSRDLKLIGFPTTLLIDREGRELGRLIGAAEWDSPEIADMIERAVAVTKTQEKNDTKI